MTTRTMEVFDRLGYEPTPMQRAFHDQPPLGWRDFRAGRGAGKTRALVAETLRVCVENPDIQAGLFTVSHGQLLHAVVRQLGELGYGAAINATWDRARLRLYLPNGSRVQLASVHSPQAAERFNTALFQLIGYDEIDFLPVHVQYRLDDRLTSTLGTLATGSADRELIDPDLRLCAYMGWSRHEFRTTSTQRIEHARELLAVGE